MRIAGEDLLARQRGALAQALDLPDGKRGGDGARREDRGEAVHRGPRDGDGDGIRAVSRRAAQARRHGGRERDRGLPRGRGRAAPASLRAPAPACEGGRFTTWASAAVAPLTRVAARGTMLICPKCHHPGSTKASLRRCSALRPVGSQNLAEDRPAHHCIVSGKQEFQSWAKWACLKVRHLILKTKPRSRSRSSIKLWRSQFPRLLPPGGGDREWADAREHHPIRVFGTIKAEPALHDQFFPGEPEADHRAENPTPQAHREIAAILLALGERTSRASSTGTWETRQPAHRTHARWHRPRASRLGNREDPRGRQRGRGRPHRTA